jgi:hypothetical protein
MACLGLGRAFTVRLSYDLWTAGLSISAPLEVAVTPWSWSLQLSLLGCALAGSLTSMDRPASALDRSARLAFFAAVSLATVASSMLSLVLTWSLVIGAQAWVVRRAGATSKAAFFGPEISVSDFIGLLALMAAFGVSAFDGPSARAIAALLLGIACFLRILSAASRPLPEATGAGLALPTAVTVFAALGWGWEQEAFGARSTGLAAAGILLLLAGWLFGWLEDRRDRRRGAWVAGFGGAGLLAAAISTTQMGAALGLAGVVMALAGCLALDLPLPKVVARLGAAAAVLLTVGVPALVGAVLLGLLVPETSASFLGWMAVAGMGLLGSLPLRDLITRKQEPTESGAALAALAVALIVVLGAALYVRLQGLVPQPVILAPLISGAIALAGWLVPSRVTAAGRSRMARAFRWPASSRIERGAAVVARPLADVMRGVRDVLEGDASLLWAMVVVVVGLLLLGVIP